MRTDVFDFHLPPERIALRPASPRDSARMLVVDADGRHSDHVVSQLPNFLRAHDVLVVNDTRVIAAQLSGRRIARAPIASSSEADHGSREENPSNKTSHPAIHATLIKRLDGSHWQALVRPAKKLVAGDLVRFGSDGRVCLLGNLDATVESKGDDGEVTLAFAFDGPMLDQAIAEVGVTPLPPYIASKRNPDAQDATDYQTMFATEEGAVAAPTAGLHFTTALYDAVQSRDVGIERVTLHVGAGTFLPVKVEDTAGHVMHAEYGLVSESVCERLNAAKSAGGRIIAVGTTSLRLLESATGEDGIVRPFAGETAIFITPGYRFRCVDVLMTNFHLPRSTLVMLISAFSGIAPIRSAYAHAIASGYRFYSYGDASLLLRAP